MKKIWIGGAAVVVVAVGVIMLTTNDTKNGDVSATKNERQTNETATRNTKGYDIPNISARPSRNGLFDYSHENLSEPVRTLLGLDGKERSYRSMLDAIGRFPEELNEDDVAALRVLLTWSIDVFPEGMPPISINAVKNDVLANLLKQKELPEAIGYQLVEMYSDTEMDPGWRDYCVQFMSTYYERAASELFLTTEDTEAQRELASNTSVSTSEAGGENIEEMDAVREAMFVALGDKDETISGTAQIGLELLSRTHEEFDPTLIKSSISAVAMDESVSTKSRQTALRMTTLTGADETTADTARMLAQTSESMLMRSAAVVTLGETGTAEDRELLESYTLSEDRQLAGAAELALQKMDARGL